MNIQRLTSVLFGLLLSGGLIASATAAQPSNPSKQNSQVQHLTCVKNAQGLMCTFDEALNGSSSVKSSSVKLSSVKLTSEQQATAAQPVATPLTLQASELASNQQLGQMSNILLGIIYFGLPIALVFVILRHDKRDAKRTQSIEGLERIWNQTPQS